MEPPDGKRVVILPRLLDRRGMALCLSVSEDVLDALRKRGCPCVPVVGTAKVLFDPDDVVPWLKEQSKPPETLTEKEASEELDSFLRNKECGDTLRTA